MTGYRTSAVHKCNLPKKDKYGIPKTAPNAPFMRRLLRTLQKHIVANPDNFRCRSFYANSTAITLEQRRHINSKHNYIIHPFSNLNSLLEFTFFVIWLSRMIYIPLLSNFPDLPHITYELDNYLSYMFQPWLILSQFFVGYIDYHTKEVVLDHRRIITRYLRTFFVFDVVSTDFVEKICNDVLEALDMEDMDRLYVIQMIVSFICTTCLYARLYSILRFLNNVGKAMALNKTLTNCICIGIKTCMILHLLSCLLYMVPQIVHHNVWPEDSWVVIAKIDIFQDVPLYKRYAESFLMTACNFFGASPGMYDTGQTSEQIFLSVIGFVGRLYTLFVLADIFRLFGVVGISESNYERRVSDMSQYMTSNELPVSTRRRIVRYYETKLHGRYFNEKEILNNLSQGLRTELYLFMARRLVKKCHFLRYLPPEAVTELITTMRLETYAPGNIIFKATDAADEVFFVLSGTVAITRERVELCHYDDGDMFGMISVDGLRHYTCVCVETTDLLVISYRDLDVFVAQYPSAVEYLKRMARNITAIYDRIEIIARSPTGSVLVELESGRLLGERDKRLKAKWFFV